MLPLSLKSTSLMAVLSAFTCVAISCASDSPSTAAPDSSAEPTVTPLTSYVTTEPHAGITSLRCEACDQVEVLGVTGPETIETVEGPMRLYGAFVAPEEENCVELATMRLTELASSAVRVEESTRLFDSSGTPIRYLYTEGGDSIDEIFIREGLARSNAFEGVHSPWLLITADKARRDRSGCIWENFDRMFPQRTPRAPGPVN